MKKIKHLPSKKKRLEEKVNRLRVAEITETQFTFIGNCGKLHTVETKTDRSIHGILSGEFIQWRNQLLIFVGVGKSCGNLTHDDGPVDALWFAVPEIEKGIVCRGYSSFSDIIRAGHEVSFV